MKQLKSQCDTWQFVSVFPLVCTVSSYGVALNQSNHLTSIDTRFVVLFWLFAMRLVGFELATFVFVR